MKKNLHPDWNHDAVVTCACGSSFVTGSTMNTLQVEICSACHPFFTGEMKFVDTQGRVDKFQQKMKLAAQKQQTHQKTKGKGKADRESADAKSYRQILREQKDSLRKVTKAA